ncbi:SDR family NAD(P)-dependent oxidoreductase [Bdellovibrio sp. HCB2-146]|uniref:SDR family NAD(P)-dependent oxidoreductase n=1 Tax=Bdellovibrio sp. HCB2-146 TaxID=3394362 RepID=UPI0039BCA84A
MYRFFYWHKFRTPEREYKPVVLITGCASGIGLSLAKLFYIDKSYRVCVTAREESLGKLRRSFAEDDRFCILALDVTSSEQRENVVKTLTSKWGSVDILVNNAGISYRSVVEHMSAKDEELQMATNYHGPMELIRLVIPLMRHSGRGKIINVSSVSGMLAMPTMASYSASKYALEGASEALWYELRPFGINVSMIQPGFIKSESFKNVRYSEAAKESESGDEAYSEFYRSMSPFVAELMDYSRTTPNNVAVLVRDVIRTQNPPLWVPATFDAELFYYLRRFVPRRFLHPFLYACLPRVRKWGHRFSHRRPDPPLLKYWWIKFTRLFQ